MSDVRNVYITKEVAEKLNITSTYLIKLAKKIGLDESEMREAGKRNDLFSDDAVMKLKVYMSKK